MSVQLSDRSVSRKRESHLRIWSIDTVWDFRVLLDEGANICFQLLRRGMDAATNLLPGEFGKPALDLIDPRGRCWREVDMIVRSARQPGFDHSRFVSGVIV